MNGIPDAGGVSGTFAALERTQLGDEDLALAAGFIAAHHAVTVDTPFADVVVCCICTPGVQRDAAAWAEHLLAAIVGGNESSDASVSVGHGPVEEAGPCRVISIHQ